MGDLATLIQQAAEAGVLPESGLYLLLNTIAEHREMLEEQGFTDFSNDDRAVAELASLLTALLEEQKQVVELKAEVERLRPVTCPTCEYRDAVFDCQNPRSPLFNDYAPDDFGCTLGERERD